MLRISVGLKRGRNLRPDVGLKETALFKKKGGIVRLLAKTSALLDFA